MIKNVTKDIFYVGVNDHQIDLFEGQYEVPNGMAYNSYVIKDDKIVIMDSVDIKFKDEWLKNIKEVLGSSKPDYLVIQHMEPDHSANIMELVKVYPEVTLVGNAKTFKMLEQFFGSFDGKKLVLTEGDTLDLGHHKLSFVLAPMVHWPEVMMTYDELEKTFFSADAFGKFGALDREEEWACEARRYYFGIVGKYGVQVQNLLNKAAGLQIDRICPLHGPILDSNLDYYLNLYNIWSSYQPETDGVAIFYTSVYGHTKEAAEKLAELLKQNNCPKVHISDLARSDMAENVEDAFRYSKIVFATTTYNSEIFPFMDILLIELTSRGFQNKTIGIIENGTWAPMAAKVIKDKLSRCKNLTFVEPVVRIMSSLNEESNEKLVELSSALTQDYVARVSKEVSHDPKALFTIGYGLYVVTTRDGDFDNGCIVNTVTQLTDKPLRVAVNVNKSNYTHEIIKKTGMLNVNTLNIDTPFKVFQDFGFVSGRVKNKMEDVDVSRSANGLVFLNQHINAFMSLKVEEYVDLGTHGMFICSVTESRVINNVETMTYTYYQKNVKPKPEEKVKGWVCKICGYVHEGDLPEDFVCPLCKHGASDFEKIK